MEFNDLINEIEEKIFDYDIDDLTTKVNDLMVAVMEGTLVNERDVQRIQGFNQILQSSLQALQTRDYLLLSDILEFRLKPYLSH